MFNLVVKYRFSKFKPYMGGYIHVCGCRVCGDGKMFACLHEFQGASDFFVPVCSFNFIHPSTSTFALSHETPTM